MNKYQSFCTCYVIKEGTELLEIMYNVLQSCIGKKVVPISVNVSRAHFTKEDLAEYICRLVDRYQVPHEVIELELTESAFFEDKELPLDAEGIETKEEVDFLAELECKFDSGILFCKTDAGTGI